MVLRTRRPTGAVSWPLILLEGGEKVGKTYTAIQLTASPRIGRAFWIALGEPDADEYGALPGADYELVEHEGTFASVLSAVEEIHALAAEVPPGEPPVMLGIDTMTAEWEWLKDWADERARKSDSNKKKLARDPHAEIVISPNIWTDTNARHRRLMRLLMTFKGVVVIIARGRETIAVDDNGRPIPNTRDYRVEGQRGLPFDASVWIRLDRDKPATVVGCRSVHTGVRPGIDPPIELKKKDWTLEWIIFEVLKCDPATAHASRLVDRKAEMTPEQIRDEALNPDTTYERLCQLDAIVADLGYENVIVSDFQGNEGLLSKLLTIKKRQKQPAPPPEPPPLADAEQHGMIADLFAQLGGFDSPQTRETYLAEVLGRPATEDELTVHDAEEVLSRLREAASKAAKARTKKAAR
ncbi:ATP-binding protein [Actinomadura litoris]|uniref:ATP-binding protein n=1 Tax=Actinomadura litoris TaxID=2678616 RepID=UPI001FA75CF7|nr:ATP-binding protein [Actinomadura litoris]